MRRNEALKLTWDMVDFEGKTFKIADTKNNEPLILPLSSYLFDLLNERRNNRNGSDYVFPGRNPELPYADPTRQLDNLKKLSGLEFALHDFRRTFITIAESIDLPYYALKRLVNHKMGNDVTAGYIVHDVERLRKPMQQITDKILFEAGRRQTAKIVFLKNMTV